MYCTASSGSPHDASAPRISPASAALLRNVSLPPRRIAAFPVLRHRRRDVDRDVRPGFVDHADHADRRAPLAQPHAVGQHPAVELLADRVGQRGDLPHVGRQRGQPLLVEHQPVEQRRAQPLRPAIGQVERVGSEHLGSRSIPARRRSPAARRPSRCGAASRACGRPAGRPFPSAQDQSCARLLLTAEACRCGVRQPARPCSPAGRRSRPTGSPAMRRMSAES